MFYKGKFCPNLKMTVVPIFFLQISVQVEFITGRIFRLINQFFMNNFWIKK